MDLGAAELQENSSTMAARFPFDIHPVPMMKQINGREGGIRHTPAGGFREKHVDWMSGQQNTKQDCGCHHGRRGSSTVGAALVHLVDGTQQGGFARHGTGLPSSIAPARSGE